MNKILGSLVVIGFLTFSSATYAGGCADDCCVTCPSCESCCCVLKSEPTEIDKHCWEVECKKICVPNVVFPWQKPRKSRCRTGCADGCASGCCDSVCCDDCNCNNGACVITVKVLKKHKYKCPSCKYTWTPVCCPTGCGDGCCDSGAVEIAPAVGQPEPAVEPAPADDVPPAPPAPSAKKTIKRKLQVAKTRTARSTKVLQAALRKIIKK